MKNTYLMTAVLVIVVGAGAFFGGMKYQQSQIPVSTGRQQGQGNFQRNGGNRPVAGEILSADDKSITVKLADGSSKIVLISGTTTVVASTTATKADLKVGSKVAVFGVSNPDGSVTASNVQLNPQMRQVGQ